MWCTFLAWFVNYYTRSGFTQWFESMRLWSPIPYQEGSFDCIKTKNQSIKMWINYTPKIRKINQIEQAPNNYCIARIRVAREMIHGTCCSRLFFNSILIMYLGSYSSVLATQWSSNFQSRKQVGTLIFS